MNVCFASVPQGEFKFMWREGPQSQPELLDRAQPESVRVSPKVALEVLRFGKPLRVMLEELQEESGAVICDCGLFVQIMARLEAEEDPSGVLLSTKNNPSQYIACACQRDFAYLRPSHVDTFLVLQESSFAGKGYWLLPLNGDRYLGILRDGPVEGSASDWRKWARKELLTEYTEKSCAENLVPGSRTWTELEYVRLQRQEGTLDSWTITPVPQTLVPKRERAAVRALFMTKAGSATRGEGTAF
jgi:hypothetical protein